MSLRDIYNLKPISDKGFIFKSGKYANHTLGELIDLDPEYILFLQTKTNMDFHADIIDECERSSQSRSRDELPGIDYWERCHDHD